jgi:hypothetical protein
VFTNPGFIKLEPSDFQKIEVRRCIGWSTHEGTAEPQLRELVLLHIHVDDAHGVLYEYPLNIVALEKLERFPVRDQSAREITALLKDCTEPMLKVARGGECLCSPYERFVGERVRVVADVRRTERIEVVLILFRLGYELKLERALGVPFQDTQ